MWESERDQAGLDWTGRTDGDGRTGLPDDSVGK